MKIQSGVLLVSKKGEYYRVVDCQEEAISLMRVNGYTLFACSTRFLESEFLLANSSVA